MVDRRGVKGMTTKIYEDKGIPKRVVRVLNHFGTGVNYGVHNDSSTILREDLLSVFCTPPARTANWVPCVNLFLESLKDCILYKTAFYTTRPRPPLYHGTSSQSYTRVAGV